MSSVQEEVVEEISSKIEDAERDKDALTNKVFFTKYGTVVKVYPKYPITGFYTTITNLLVLELSYVNRKERMENEVKVKEKVRDAGLKAPEVLTVGEKAIEFEKVSGQPGFEFLESCTEDEATELGRKVGGFLSKLHDMDVALRDFRLYNMIVDGDDIYLIDHEYSRLDAPETLKWVDELTLFSSVRQTPNYMSFRSGYTEKKEVSWTTTFLSSVTSFLHALFIERSFKRLKNVFLSAKKDIMGG